MELRGIHYTALKSLNKLSDQKAQILFENIGDWSEVYNLGPDAWLEFVNFKADDLAILKEEYRALNLLEIEKKLTSLQVKTIFLGDQDYPPLLAEIEKPPLCLYLKGQIQPLKPCLAIVGSRSASQYGKRVARELASQLAACGFVVVSGLAKGIDSQAHWGALDQGLSYGVLAFGHSFMYPKENRELADRICQEGALIGEYPYFIRPFPAYFPARNRIISGLSLGTLVVEARGTSGSLITAGLAAEQNREIFAVPGNIFSENSRGCHDLIKQGAKLVEGIEDILDEFQYLNLGEQGKAAAEKDIVELSLVQQKIMQYLQAEPLHLDVLALQLNFGLGVLLAELTQMEIMGLVKAHPGGYYSI